MRWGLLNLLESACDPVQNPEFWVRIDGGMLTISDYAINYKPDRIEKSKAN